ncbi:MAG: hypothetical protein IJG24_08720 [Selenomonadaceae bacterium]|nr:hypothetical protein [Selenomonadaceae bacterium]
MPKYVKGTPLTTEEIHALREYIRELQALKDEEPENLMTAEHAAIWDEVMEAYRATGEIPPKYADRIGTNEVVTHYTPSKGYVPEGIPQTAFYDIVHSEWEKKLAALFDKYHDEIFHALLLDMETDNEAVTPVTDIIEAVIASYTMPHHNLPSLGALPNASEFNTLNRILLTNGALKKSGVTRSERITTERRTDDGVTTVRYTRSNRGDKHIITITNADVLLKKNNRHIKKLLPFTLQKMQQQSFPSKLAVDLEELVSLGMYSTTDNAWRGLSAFAQAMENIDIHWQRKVTNRATKKGDKTTTTTVEEGGVLIYHRKRRQNIGYLSVNEEFPIAALAREYTVFPSWAYALPIAAFDLVLYIFYVARMQKDDILRTGGFNLSLQAIHERLGLPTVKEVETKMHRKYKERIRQPIEDAIEAIETAVAQSDAAGKFYITPMTDDDADIKEWLQGYIRIELKDEYAATFRTIAEHKQAHIEAAEKAKVKAIAEAQAKQELQGNQGETPAP